VVLCGYFGCFKSTTAVSMDNNVAKFLEFAPRKVTLDVDLAQHDCFDLAVDG